MLEGMIGPSNSESTATADDNATGGRASRGNACGHTLAHVDNDRRGSQRDPDVTREYVGDNGRNLKEEDRQRNKRQESNGFCEEGVGAIRENEQHFGDG